jgi:transglutaminase-like putative cysteine protease
LKKVFFATLLAAICSIAVYGAAPETDKAVKITAPENRHVKMESKVDFLESVSAVDSSGNSVDVYVDASGVDLKVPGEYAIKYRAVGADGANTEVAALFTVTKRDPDEAYKLLDEILEKIITEDMTLAQQAKAIYDYVKTSIKYKAGAEHATSLDGAVFGIEKKTGDCFTCAAYLEQLLTRANIPNIRVTRLPTKANGYDHNWNLVDVGGGWYHCDATPSYRGVSGYTGFMFPEVLARKQPSSNGVRDRYSYDSSLYPEVEWDN